VRLVRVVSPWNYLPPALHECIAEQYPTLWQALWLQHIVTELKIPRGIGRFFQLFSSGVNFNFFKVFIVLRPLFNCYLWALGSGALTRAHFKSCVPIWFLLLSILALCLWRARVFGRGGGWKQVVGVTMTTSSEILIEMLVCWWINKIQPCLHTRSEVARSSEYIQHICTEALCLGWHVFDMNLYFYFWLYV
jgi:hypothetical protein